MQDWGIFTWIFFIVLIVVLLVYSAGTVKDVTAVGTSSGNFVSKLFGPGSYAKGTA